jgi:hypothetical protein
MGKLGDVRVSHRNNLRSVHRKIGRIEEAFGYKGADPERRERLCRDLLLISDLYFGVDGRLPQVRARNVDRALAVLRGHAAALQAHLWWGRTDPAH